MLAKRDAVEQLHREKEAAVDLAGVVDRDQVAMAQHPRDLDLAQEPGADLLLALEIGQQQLQRDGAARFLVGGTKDRGGGALADRARECGSGRCASARLGSDGRIDRGSSAIDGQTPVPRPPPRSRCRGRRHRARRATSACAAASGSPPADSSARNCRAPSAVCRPSVQSSSISPPESACSAT